jgi:hypothetical protein
MLDDAQAKNGLVILTRLAQREPESERWLAKAIETDLGRLAGSAVEVALESG